METRINKKLEAFKKQLLLLNITILNIDCQDGATIYVTNRGLLTSSELLSLMDVCPFSVFILPDSGAAKIYIMVAHNKL